MDKNIIAETIVVEIIKDILNRRGLNSAMNSIDEDIQEEIKNVWKDIIIKNI